MLISQTPLRVSFAGGGTDLDPYIREFGGEVIGSAIDKYVFVFVKERFDHHIIVSWRKFELVDRVDDIQHELVREAMKLAKVGFGVEVITTADIPSEGSGLGSSSALTVGLVNALFKYQNAQRSVKELAEHACGIEIETLRHPIGRQDQHFAAYGGIQHVKFARDGTISCERLSLSPALWGALNQECLLFYTGTTRKAANILERQMATVRDHTAGYHAMKALIPRVRKSLEEGRLDEFGRLMHENWQIKRDLADGITSPEIDRMYRTALDAGATGGKVCGAGGGGFLFLVCPVDRQQALREALSHYSEMPFQFEQDGAKVLLDVRRPVWKFAKSSAAISPGGTHGS